MPRGIDITSWATLTSMINEAKSPNQFLKRFLYGSHESLITETIEVAVQVGGRVMAPFVRKNGQAIMVDGRTSEAHHVEAPNIRIKRPMEAATLITERPLSTAIYPNRGELNRAIAAKVADDVQVLADQITNAEEWLCAQSLRGVIEYEVEDQEVFTITFPRTAGHSFTDSAPWDVSPADTPDIHATFLAVKRLINANAGLAVTDCILGSEASDALMDVVRLQELPLMDNSGVSHGRYEALVNQYREDGVLYLGRLDGIDFWEYSREVEVNGSDEPLIRAKYAEFVARTPAAQFKLYYGAIPDIDAIQSGRFIGERFSKSWVEKDPSALVQLAHSRPLPVPRRPDATCSVKVVSG